MAIEIGAVIRGIHERAVTYQAEGVPQKLYIRDVQFEVVGMPPEVLPVPTFTIPVTDATQWDTLRVGQTCTIAIHPPA